MHRFVFSLCFFMVLFGVSQVARGQLSLTADFDHGSLLSWSGNSNAINLVGRDNYYGDDKWRWVYFKAAGVQGAQPTFSISRNFAGDSTPGLHELEEHEMVYSYDQQTWHFFDNNQLGAVNYTFSNATPFAQNDVYVAYSIPYSYGRSVEHTQTVLASPWASPTVSGRSTGVIGQSPARTDDLGRSIPELDLFAYRITNPATDSTSPKRKIVISSGLHASETIGTYTYEGLVDWLISDDPRAARLRDIVEVFGYPVLNPSGRYAGMNRTTVGNPNWDPNGLWDSSRWSNSNNGCGNNNCQDIRESGLAMIADVFSTPGDSVDAFIDFHSTVPDYENPTGLPHDFGFVDSDDSNADWWLEVQSLMAPNVIEYTTNGSGPNTTTGFARRILDAEVEITFETQFTWERNIDYYHNLGTNFGIAFYNAWARIDGDYNADGQVDAADYAIWRDGSALGSASYGEWKTNFGATTGAASSSSFDQTGTAAVPEPSTFLLAGLSGIAGIACIAIRQSH